MMIEVLVILAASEISRSGGLMDKALLSGGRDCGFKLIRKVWVTQHEGPCRQRKSRPDRGYIFGFFVYMILKLAPA